MAKILLSFFNEDSFFFILFEQLCRIIIYQYLSISETTQHKRFFSNDGHLGLILKAGYLVVLIE
jgi:hypothetical protein